MQKGMKEYVLNLKNEFVDISNTSYVKLDTGEMFTKSEFEKYIQSKTQKYVIDIQNTLKQELNNDGIDCTQKIVNIENIKKYNKNKNKLNKQKHRYEGGEFNIAYRERVGDFHNMKLNANEKLTFYVLRDFIQYPTNSVVINDRIPTIKDLEPLIGLSDRTIKKCIASLEKKELIKRKQTGHRKTMFINPMYFASGKDLDIEVLQMFGLVDIDEDKLNDYLD